MPEPTVSFISQRQVLNGLDLFGTTRGYQIELSRSPFFVEWMVMLDTDEQMNEDSNELNS